MRRLGDMELADMGGEEGKGRLGRGLGRGTLSSGRCD